jgi:hypothetical protein
VSAVQLSVAVYAVIQEHRPTPHFQKQWLEEEYHQHHGVVRPRLRVLPE